MELGNLFKEYLENDSIPCEIIDLVALDLPLYTSKVENDRPPEAVFDLEKKLKKARALVFVAPEYNGSLPPVLNNSIAWISRVGSDWRSCFNGKPALIATHSGGGGSQVLMAMRLQLSYLGVNVMGRQILTHKGKDLNHDSMTSVLDQLKNFAR